jgi:hypothetical protein
MRLSSLWRCHRIVRYESYSNDDPVLEPWIRGTQPFVGLVIGASHRM